MSKIIGYVRVSTQNQDTDNQKQGILDLANRHSFVGQVKFIEEKVSGSVAWRNRKLGQVVDELNNEDILIVSELSRLGRSMLDILILLEELKKRGVKVYAVKENYQLNGDSIQSKVMTQIFSILIELERDLISQRTREALAVRKAKGVKLGRPKGKHSESDLDDKVEQIKELIAKEIPVSSIAKLLGVSDHKLRYFIKSRGIKQEE